MFYIPARLQAEQELSVPWHSTFMSFGSRRLGHFVLRAEVVRVGHNNAATRRDMRPRASASVDGDVRCLHRFVFGLNCTMLSFNA